MVGAVSLSLGITVSLAMNISSKINVEDTTNFFPEARDPVDFNAGKSLNYLLIGSDDRSGENESIGGFEEGMRSDTTILIHVSADRKRIEVISIPRDSIVNIPSCVTSTGETTFAMYNAQFNSSFAQGDTPGSAAVCTLRTFEENTGLHIDGYTVIDFKGFQGVVDSIGGIQMNIPHDMVSEKADLNLVAGEQLLNGKDALAFARARTFEVGESDGSDLGRIDRQQQLLSALSSQIITGETLTNPTKITSILTSILENTTVSEELSNIPNVAGFLFSLKSISQEDISFYTVPNEPWVEDQNRVIWTNESVQMWENISNDIPIIAPEEVS